MQVIKLGDNIMTYFIHVFSLETHTYLDVRIHTRLWPEMFRITDGRIYNGYMKSDNVVCLFIFFNFIFCQHFLLLFNHLSIQQSSLGRPKFIYGRFSVKYGSQLNTVFSAGSTLRTFMRTLRTLPRSYHMPALK